MGVPNCLSYGSLGLFRTRAAALLNPHSNQCDVTASMLLVHHTGRLLGLSCQWVAGLPTLQAQTVALHSPYSKWGDLATALSGRWSCSRRG